MDENANQVGQHGKNRRNQQNRVKRTSMVDIIRRDIVNPGGKLGDNQQNEINEKEGKCNIKRYGFKRSFPGKIKNQQGKERH